MNESIHTPPADTNVEPRKHSGIGIASFVMGLVNILLFFIMLFVAVSAAAAAGGGPIDEHAPATIMLGLFVILIGLICLVGTGLGIASVMQKNKRRVFGVIGLCLNGGIVLLIILMILVGLSHT